MSRLPCRALPNSSRLALTHIDGLKNKSTPVCDIT